MEQPRLKFVERAATLQALRAAVETGEIPETATADNIKSLVVTLGCAQSIESGTPMYVDDLFATAGRR